MAGEPRHNIIDNLFNMGFEKHHINRSLKLYEKHYNIIKIGYDTKIITEIIFRLKCKDNLKKFETKYYSKVNIKQSLEAIGFSLKYINIAIEQYENVSSLSTLSYDIQIIAESIMKLRADGDRKQQQLFETNKVHETRSNNAISDTGDTLIDYNSNNIDSMKNCNDDNKIHLDYYDGYLWKQSSKQKKKWQKRWFIISNGELQYFKDSEKALTYFKCERDNNIDHKKRKEFIGNIGLCKVNKIVIESHKYVLSITTPLQRIYLLKTLNIDEYDKWFYVLSSQTTRLLLNKSKYQNTNYIINEDEDDEKMEHKKREKLLIKIQNDNKYCADCNQLFPEWVSINIGVILCLDCCAIHRGFGVQISKMRSLTLDFLDLNTLNYIVNIGGNDKLNNQLLEYNLSKSHKINYKTCALKQRSDFIHYKYVKKLFINTNNLNNNRLDFNQYLFTSSQINDCFGIIFALFNGAHINEKHYKYNYKTALQEAILKSNNEAVQLLINSEALPVLQI